MDQRFEDTTVSDVFRIDPHVKVLDESVVERAERRGLDAIVYAPHFTQLTEIRRRAAQYETDALQIVPAREVFTGSARNRKHVLALGLSEPVPDFVDLDAAMAEFERQDATVLAPHPEFLTVGLDAEDLRAYRDVIDAVEVCNPKHWPQHNRRARELVDELGLPAFGSSYAHLHWTVGDVWTEFDVGAGAAADRAANARMATDWAANADQETGDQYGAEDAVGSENRIDVAAALTSGEGRVCRRTGVAPASRATAEFLHLLWENSGKKVGRVACSGQEATHPEQPAYDGRFDGASVY